MRVFRNAVTPLVLLLGAVTLGGCVGEAEDPAVEGEVAQVGESLTGAVAQEAPLAPPSFSAPVYPAPTYSAPVYQAPVYQAPVYQAPVYQAPVYQAPSPEVPGPAGHPPLAPVVGHTGIVLTSPLPAVVTGTAPGPYTITISAP